MNNQVIRRSISLPLKLDNRIELLKKEYSYNVKNELYVELIELGLIKFYEDLELKNQMYSILKKMDMLLEHKE